MDGNNLRRRTHGFANDYSDPALGNPPVTSPFQEPLGYSTAPSPAFPLGQPGGLITFQGIQPQETPGISRQYPQHQPAFQNQAGHYSQHPAPEQQAYEQGLWKRPRLDSNMQVPFFLRPASYAEEERSPKSEYPQNEGTGQGSPSTFAPFGDCLAFCPPFSMYQPSPGYQAIPSTPVYETPSPAYSADMRSPSLPGPPQQHPAVPGPSMEQPQFLYHLPEDPVTTRQLQVQYPPLEPAMHHPGIQSTTQGAKPYEPHGTPQGVLKAEPSPLKLKNPEKGFHSGGFQVMSGYPIDEYSPSGPTHPEPRMYTQHSMGRPQNQPQPYVAQPYVPPVPTLHEPFDLYQLAPHQDLPVVMTNQKPPATKRGPFKDRQKREKTAQVRKIGSCIRCRMQRIRCEFAANSKGDEHAPCDGCYKILGNTRIHRLPCRRWKLVDVKLSKSGNAEWTYRWKDSTALPEITKWQDNNDREIYLDDGFTKTIRVKVRQFKVMEGDQKTRKCFNYDTGRTDEIEMKPFALVDVAETKLQYEKYLTDGQGHIFKSLLGDKDRLLWRTYDMAQQRRDAPNTSPEERDLLAKTLKLWVAVRLTTRSFEIAGEGKEALGQKPDSKGRILLHPVFGQQLDKVLLDHVLTKLRRETLDVLQTITQQKKRSTWLTTYLVSFILLHNVALITRHDKDRAEKHGENADKKPLAIWHKADNVKQYHLGANIFLAYFHYCNKGVFPFSDECKPSDLQNLAELDSKTIKFVEWTKQQIDIYRSQWKCLRDEGFRTPANDSAEEHMLLARTYSHDYFFISQLYEEYWMPRNTIVDRNASRKIGPARKDDRPKKRACAEASA